jgi:hypothetical protein
VSQGIPCCKQFSITITPTPFDCGATATTIAGIVWTLGVLYPGFVTGSGSITGNSGSISATGVPPYGGDVFLSGSLCNPGNTYGLIITVTWSGSVDPANSNNVVASNTHPDSSQEGANDLGGSVNPVVLNATIVNGINQLAIKLEIDSNNTPGPLSATISIALA